MNADEQAWCRKHADKIRRIAKVTCEVNPTHDKGRDVACGKCIKAAREFFNDMTFGHEVVGSFYEPAMMRQIIETCDVGLPIKIGPCQYCGASVDGPCRKIGALSENKIADNVAAANRGEPPEHY